MKESNLFYKQLTFFSIFSVFTGLFAGCRCFQLFFLTDNSGVCYEFQKFNLLYAGAVVAVFLSSFLFFKFIVKPNFQSLDFIKSSKLLGFFSLMLAFVLIVGSFAVLFGTNSPLSVSSVANLFYFLMGVFFAVSLLFLAVCCLKSDANCKLAFSFVFYSSFLWCAARLLSLLFTEYFLKFLPVEYSLSVLGLVFIFLFLFSFGQLTFNFNSSRAGFRFMLYGITGVFAVFINVFPKIFMKVYELCGILACSNSTYYKKNLDVFNFYNFNLVDFCLAVFICLFLFYVVRKKENFAREFDKV